MHNKKSEQGSVNIKKITLPELKDLLDRQNNLLNNSKFIEKLPDQGKKITSFKEKIEIEINARNSLDDTCDLMSQMVLTNMPNELEWSGKNAINNKIENSIGGDSDDDSDPLRLVATHSGTIKSYSKRVEPIEPSLVTNKDVEDAKSVKLSSAPYTLKLCEKYSQNSTADRFKPHEPRQKALAKDGFKSSSEHVRERLGKNWEITAATPPVPIHGRTEMVSLTDSLILQESYARRLKEIQLEEAMSRLRTSSLPIGAESCLPTRNLMKYRNAAEPSLLFEGTPVSTRCEDSTTEVEEPESDSAVFFNIVEDPQ